MLRDPLRHEGTDRDVAIHGRTGVVLDQVARLVGRRAERKMVDEHQAPVEPGTQGPQKRALAIGGEVQDGPVVASGEDNPRVVQEGDVLLVVPSRPQGVEADSLIRRKEHDISCVPPVVGIHGVPRGGEAVHELLREVFSAPGKAVQIGVDDGDFHGDVRTKAKWLASISATTGIEKDCTAWARPASP